MKTFKVALLLLLGGFLITSCEKENEEDDYRSDIINLRDYLFQEIVDVEDAVDEPNSLGESGRFKGKIFFAEKDTLYYLKNGWDERRWVKNHYEMDGIKLRINSGTRNPSAQQSFHDKNYYVEYHKGGKFVLSTENTDLDEQGLLVHHMIITKK